MRDFSKGRIILRADLPPDHTSESQILDYIDAGFNVITMTEDSVRANSRGYLDCLKKFEEYGIDVYIRGYDKQIPHYFKKYFDNTDFSDYGAVKGFFVADEPTQSQIAEVSSVYVIWFNERYAQKGFEWFFNYFGAGGENYKKDVDMYFEKVVDRLDTKKQYFSIDYYPQRRSAGKNYLEDVGWLSSMAYCAEKVKERKICLGAYIQTFEGGWRDVRAPESSADIRFLAYIYLAFGVRQLSYFGYRTNPEFYITGIISRDGTVLDSYKWVKEINTELRCFDEVYLRYLWQGVMLYEGEKRKNFNEEFSRTRTVAPYKDDRIKTVHTQEDLVVGCFRDENGKPAYIIVSYGETTDISPNPIDICFSGCSAVMFYKKGEKNIVRNTDRLETVLEKGEGVFVIPQEDANG